MRCLFLLLLLPFTSFGQHAMETRMVLDFSNAAAMGEWAIINDVVMGGESSSAFEFTEDGTAIFSGTVSLENNGGFASTRSRPQSFELGGFKGMRLMVRGDGKTYQLRLRTSDGFDGIAYQDTFSTEADTWTAVDVDFDTLQPSFRGRRVPDAPPFDPSSIRQIGLLIADKQSGPFALEIRSVEAY